MIDPNVLLAAASVLLLVIFTAFFVFAIRHQESIEPKEVPAFGVELLRQHYAAGATIEQPTPYFVAPIPASPDPLEISANLDKKILLGAFMLMTVFLLTGVYFVAAMPMVQAKGTENQLHQRVLRGQSIYANLCYDCHGETGQGITGYGLPINIAQNKYDTLAADPVKLKEREAQLRLVIERGRAKAAPQISMPQWARYEGGPLGPEQVNQILAFIEHGTADEWAHVVQVRQDGGLAVKPEPPAPPKVPTGVDGGFALVKSNPQAACTTCHSIVRNSPSVLPQAPNLANYAAEGPIAAELKALRDRDPQWLEKWLGNAPGIKPGIVMPAFSDQSGGRLTAENIKAIAEYLKTMGTPQEPK